ncbi:hypothetical protein [Streptomyces sp. NPDC001205]
MSTFVRFGRWTAELYQRAIYLQQQPKPKCPTCGGTGALEVGGGYVLDHTWQPDTEPCPCWDPFRTWRLPLWPRSQRTETEPF